MLGADLGELRRDLADRRLPGDTLEAAVGATAQRMLDPPRVVHVERNAHRLVADVARSDRVALVGAHGGDPPAAHVDAYAAIVAAQYAYGGEVVGIERQRFARDRGIDGLRGGHLRLSSRVVAATCLAAPDRDARPCRAPLSIRRIPGMRARA